MKTRFWLNTLKKWKVRKQFGKSNFSGPEKHLGEMLQESQNTHFSTRVGLALVDHNFIPYGKYNQDGWLRLRRRRWERTRVYCICRRVRLHGSILIFFLASDIVVRCAMVVSSHTLTISVAFVVEQRKLSFYATPVSSRSLVRVNVRRITKQSGTGQDTQKSLQYIFIYIAIHRRLRAECDSMCCRYCVWYMTLADTMWSGGVLGWPRSQNVCFNTKFYVSPSFDRSCRCFSPYCSWLLSLVLYFRLVWTYLSVCSECSLSVLHK